MVTTLNQCLLHWALFRWAYHDTLDSFLKSLGTRPMDLSPKFMRKQRNNHFIIFFFYSLP
jgi:hypothetical protein